MMIRVSLLAMLVLFSPWGLTNTPGDLEQPALEKCGEARLTVLFWDVYDSTLYAPEGQYTPGVLPIRLEIRYLRSIKAADLVEQTRKEWVSQNILSPSHEAWLEKLASFWPDVDKNDVIALELDTTGAATFRFNDAVVGQVTDRQFGIDFSGIWLSPQTTRPELRAALIGGDQSANES